MQSKANRLTGRETGNHSSAATRLTMTRFAVPFFAFIALFAAAGMGVAARSSAQAAVPYTVSVSPAKETVPVGELAVFNVKVQG